MSPAYEDGISPRKMMKIGRKSTKIETDSELHSGRGKRLDFEQYLQESKACE